MDIFHRVGALRTGNLYVYLTAYKVEDEIHFRFISPHERKYKRRRKEKPYTLLQLYFTIEGRKSKWWISTLLQGRGRWNIFLTNKATRHLPRTSTEIPQKLLVVWLPPCFRSSLGPPYSLSERYIWEFSSS